MDADVYLEQCDSYDQNKVNNIINSWKHIFQENIFPGNAVIIKPNWLAASHKYDPDEWECVITHPIVITSVLKIVLECLQGQGNVVITDGPQTDSSWAGIMSRMKPGEWIEMGSSAGIDVSVMDLRLHEWTNVNDVTVARKELPGDPKGSTICYLNKHSEFLSHQASQKGYYGADYNKTETNEAHHGAMHKYKVSRSIIEADVFINIPKLKTHKKAGITCSLKNLVGINTYKNWLPHHNEGTPDQGGDQFPSTSTKNRSEAFLVEKFKSFLYRFPFMGKAMIPVKKLGKLVFGDTKDTIRSGNWYGNDTLWRMVLDLNKVLFYSNSDGSLRSDESSSRKRYISVIDGIIGGHGKGPEAPDTINSGVLLLGVNPVAVDAVCTKVIGFDWRKIPSVANAFSIKTYPLAYFSYDEIRLNIISNHETISLSEWCPDNQPAFTPHFGWKSHIELQA